MEEIIQFASKRGTVIKWALRKTKVTKGEGQLHRGSASDKGPIGGPASDKGPIECQQFTL